MKNVKQEYERIFNEPLTEEILLDAIEKWNGVVETGATVMKTMLEAEPNVDLKTMKFSDSSENLFDVSTEDIKMILASNKLLSYLFLRPQPSLMMTFNLGCSLLGVENMFRSVIEGE